MSATPVPMARSRVMSIVGIVLCFGLPMLSLGKAIAPGDDIAARLIREGIWFAMAGLILLWVLKVERLPLSSIGLRRPTRGTIGWGVAATIALIATVMLSFAIIIPALGLRQNMTATGNIVQVPIWLMLLTAVRAGICEEILYRGYPIERLQALTGSPAIAAIVVAAFFFLAHLGWGGAQMIVVAFGTIILVGLYLWRRDLPACMIAHILADVIGFSLARAQMG